MVTLVIANGLRYGTRAALTNIAGVQAGLTIVIGIVAVGTKDARILADHILGWVAGNQRKRRIDAQDALLGGVEGQGFVQMMDALEVGRVNVAARGVGIAHQCSQRARAAQQRGAGG